MPSATPYNVLQVCILSLYNAQCYPIQCTASVSCPVECSQASQIQYKYKYITAYTALPRVQCISSVFCPVESSQALQMHLIGSHDKNPDLFADNDGSADENADDATSKYDNSGDDNLDGDDDNGDNMTEIFMWVLCSTQCVHFDLVHSHAWHRLKVKEMVVNVMMINDD